MLDYINQAQKHILINKEKFKEKINIKGKIIKIATIDTILSFYLAFIYINNPYYDYDRLTCMSEFLFKVQAKNRLQQKGLLKRFTINCYGKQKTLEDMREEKAKLYAKVRKNEIPRNSKIYNMNFFRYIPKEDYKSINKSKKNMKHHNKQSRKYKKY